MTNASRRKHALVTGHKGFIGRHMFDKLVEAGYNVWGYDIVDGNDDARDLFRRDSGPFDVVVHCAAVVGGRETIDNSPLVQAVNFELDAGLFQWAARTRPVNVVYISSPAAYPAELQYGGVNWPIDRLTRLDPRLLYEDDIDLSNLRMPDALYGWSKLTGELLAQKAREAGVKVTVVRPFSGYGEDQSTDYPFAAFAKRALAREDPFEIWGNGTQVRDWIHVDDICDAIMTAVELGINGPINLGTGKGVSMLQLARMFINDVNTTLGKYNPGIVLRTDRPAGVAYRVADVTRMNNFYTAKVSLEEGVSRALHPAVNS